jgi:hypothetical protein
VEREHPADTARYLGIDVDDALALFERPDRVVSRPYAMVPALWMEMTTPSFEDFRRALIGLDVSHAWLGYGSALFLELGRLKPGRPRRDGAIGNPKGDITVMIEWSWRIEESVSIICGSCTGKERWRPTLDLLLGATVVDISLFGRLPEISLHLSNGLFVVSFMTDEGDPEWALLDRRHAERVRSLSVRDGQLHVEDTEASA